MKYVFLSVLISAGSAFADFSEDTVPYSFIAGQVDGMKIIRGLPKNSALAKLGVKQNDIVIDVDGNPIVNQQSSKDAYEAKDLRTAVVLRNGKKVSLR